MITTIEAYFDDSADAKMERYCASGGFFGSPDQWDDFLIQWSHETHDLRKPFHATDCEGGYEQFAGWPKEKRDELVTKLVDIIQDIQFGGFASIVPIEDYRKAFPNCSSDEPYLLTIPHTIMNMAVLADRSDLGSKIWFERGGPVGFIAETFKSIQQMDWKPARRLQSVAFAGKELHALQAADLLAREAFKRFDNLGVLPMRRPLRRIGERVFFY